MKNFRYSFGKKNDVLLFKEDFGLDLTLWIAYPIHHTNNLDNFFADPVVAHEKEVVEAYNNSKKFIKLSDLWSPNYYNGEWDCCPDAQGAMSDVEGYVEEFFKLKNYPAPTFEKINLKKTKIKLPEAVAKPLTQEQCVHLNNLVLKYKTIVDGLFTGVTEYEELFLNTIVKAWRNKEITPSELAWILNTKIP